MLAEAQESGQILDEEQLAFLADPGIPDDQAAQSTIPNTAVLMANLSNYGSDVILESFEQTQVVDFTNNEITSDSNIILYSQYLQEMQQAAVQDNNLYAQQDSMILSVIKQMSKQMINHKAQRIKPTLYGGSIISSQHVASPVIYDEETLILEEVSRSKMLAKQNDPMSKEKKVNTTPINYAELNRLSKDFGKHFVLQQELTDEHAFWLQTSRPNIDQSASSPVKIEALKELPKGVLLSVMNSTNFIGESGRLKGKYVLDNATIITNATTIAPGMFKLDIEPLSHRLKNNRDVHEDYLKKTIENTNTIRGLVERARKQNPSEPLLDFACKFTKHVESSKTPDSNTPVLPSTGLKSSTSASRSQPTSNKKNDRISQSPSSNMKNKVEVQCRRVKSKSNKKNRVKDPICDANVKQTMLNVNSELICIKCKQCKFDANHDMCFLDFVNDVNVHSKSKSDKKSQQHNIRKATGKVFTEVGQKWKPTSRLFTIVGNSCPLTRITPTKVVHLKVVYMTGNRSQLMNFVSKFMGIVRFGNDQIAKIMGNLEGVDLHSGSRDTNLYTISLDDMLKNSPICLLSKASKTKSWLWHHRLSHLNFGTLNKLAKDGLKRGIPKLKFKKDHMCLACALGKSKKSSYQPKAKDTNQEKLYLLHMDLCGPMHVESINGKRLVPNPVPQQTFNPTTRNDWDHLFQPMFDEYFNPPTSFVSPVPIAAAPRAIEIAGSPSSTIIDQDAPSSSTSSTNQQQQSSIILQGVEEPIPNALFDDPCHEPLHDVSTSHESSSNV
ncbi:retrovirus-related pol polyprotein from transposon TNT 1-94 [Tanacetum coccineum]